MLLQQFYLGCLAHASYIVGDRTSRTAVVVDPQRDVQRYLDFASEHGLTIEHVFLTHFHADFVAGHLELRERTGAVIHLGARAKAEYPFVPMRDGESLRLGRVRIDVLETPGHTPESISLLVYDLDASAEAPHAVLTGDTLFVGDVGRPDLRASLGWSATDLGGLLYDSLHHKLMPLPDATVVMPAHGAGSLCGKALSRELTSTIGEQRASNYALQPMSKDAFVAVVTADQPDAPDYFSYDAVLNSRERPTLDATLERELTAIDMDALSRVMLSGAQVLDTRDPVAFGDSHVSNSLNIGLGGPFATWAGTLLARDRPVVLIADPGREEEAALRLGRIGFDNVMGYLEGGIAAADSAPGRLTTTGRVSPERAQALLVGGAMAVDVRAPSERQATWIEGSVHLPLNHLITRLSELPAGRPLLVFCAGGYRSSIAASLLRMAGLRDVVEIAGGITAWEAAGLPVRRG